MSDVATVEEVYTSTKLQALWDTYAKNVLDENVCVSIRGKSLIGSSLRGSSYLTISKTVERDGWGVLRTNGPNGSHYRDKGPSARFPGMSGVFNAEKGTPRYDTATLFIEWQDEGGRSVPFKLATNSKETRRVFDVLQRDIDQSYTTHCM